MKHSIKKTRSLLLEKLTHKFALPLVLMFRRQNSFNYSYEQLLGLPDHTLGKDLAVYLKKQNLQMIQGYIRHDCKHILLGYEMDEAGEARMQFYFLGNRHYSVPVVITSIMCFFLMPDHWKDFYYEFRKGRRSKPFDNVDFGKAILLNTKDLRKQFEIEI
jgi:ubiquinone biosynthesis protein Coq4